MHKLVRQLITEWRRLELPLDGTLVVGVSGGADSSALLAALADLKVQKKLAVNIVAAHYNHRLRGAESDADEAFVKNLADRLGARFVGGAGKLAGRSDLEQRAREARYAFLAKVADKEGSAIVLTAHTINDQAETFLINLIRGSGPEGLGAMRPTGILSAGKSASPSVRGSRSAITLVRPMLRWAMRAETEAFCKAKDIRYRQDEMNDDRRFTRVRVRKELIPMLGEFNPKIVETLARTAGLLAETASRVTQNTQNNGQDEIPVKDLKSLPQSELNSLVREWLRRQRGDLRGVGFRHIEAIGRLVHSQKSGRTVEIPRSGRVVKAAGRLTFKHG